jgi:hypothetical protein
MPAFKLSVSRVLAGLAASAFSAPLFAATLIVNNEAPLNLQTPPGFTYVTQGDTGTLSVATDGFAFCANVFPSTQHPGFNEVALAPQHDQWRFPTAIDLPSIIYGGGVLAVNHNAQGVVDTTLVCHTAGAQGETLTALTDGILSSSYESKTVEQFTNLINWIPSQGFNWADPDWSLVPTDPCSPSAGQPARVVENITCAAVSGARPAAAGATERAPTLWTGTDGVNFFYVARIDARYGEQNEADGTGPALPEASGEEHPDGSFAATLRVVEAYDRGVVGVGGGYLGDIGLWCILTEVPATLTANVCVGAPVSGLLNGPLGSDFPAIEIGTPPLGTSRRSYYVGFVRPIVGAPPSVNEPAVALSILLEPSVIGEGGDAFKGDDVVFGFLPVSQGFPWMHGQ